MSPESTSLHVANLTRQVIKMILVGSLLNACRNVNEDHIREIFGKFGDVSKVDLPMDSKTKLSKGFAYVEFNERQDAEKAQLHMEAGWLDGKKLNVNFVLVKPKISCKGFENVVYCIYGNSARSFATCSTSFGTSKVKSEKCKTKESFIVVSKVRI